VQSYDILYHSNGNYVKVIYTQKKMKAINIKFLEEYKSVDKFIKDSFGSVDGVSEYIRTMERIEGNKSDEAWKDDYYKLKHMRWIRNQLAHEVSIDSDICEREDLEWLCDFHARLKKCDDSLAKAYRKKLKRKKSIILLAVIVLLIACLGLISLHPFLVLKCDVPEEYVTVVYNQAKGIYSKTLPLVPIIVSVDSFSQKSGVYYTIHYFPFGTEGMSYSPIDGFSLEKSLSGLQ